MTMFGSQWLANSSSGVVVENSALFVSGREEDLSFTPTAGNRDTWTLSTWFNRGKTGGGYSIFSAGVGYQNGTYLEFNGNGALGYFQRDGDVTTDALLSNEFFVDIGWYHLVLAVDTTNGTEAYRVRMYINNTELTYASTNYPVQNTDTDVNSAVGHYLGNRGNLDQWFDGYLAESVMIEDSQLTPSSFGETNADTGQWTPKSSGAIKSLTFGSEGWYLDNVTNAETDASGNSNNFTNNNTVVTSSHTPTNRYCMMNPLDAVSPTLSDGNLAFTDSNGSAWRTARATMAIPSTGKWYWECIATTSGNGGDPNFGIVADTVNTQVSDWYQDALAYAYSTRYDSVVNNDWTGTSRGTYTGGNVLQIAYDADTGKLHFGIQNSWINGGDPADGSDPDFTTSTTLTFLPYVAIYNSKTGSINFGQSAFAYTPPTGFSALNTDNLPDPAIADPSDYFTPYIYTGDDSGTSRVFTGVGFAPNLVWTKARSSAFAHSFFDTVRGTGKYIASSYAGAEVTNPSSGYITAFGSDGYTFSDGSSNRNNYNADSTYVSWNWVEGATPGFDIVTYTGNATARTIAHNLGVVPEMLLIKNRDQGDKWAVYHAGNTSAPATEYLVLNERDATADLNTAWNDTAPTSSVFTVGTASFVNADSEDFVAYVFAPVEGFSTYGSYVGNGNASGPMVNLGFQPAFLLIKSTADNKWIMKDSKRSPFNVSSLSLVANNDDAELTGDSLIDINSNGFKLRTTGSGVNSSGVTYVFWAIAETPFKTANAR